MVGHSSVIAMACDKPIARHELMEHSGVIEKHVKAGTLVLYENRYVPNYEKVKSLLNEYSIRGIGKSIDIFFNDKKLGDRVLPIALEELHESAIYFLAGTRYKVKELGYPEKNYAKLERIPRDHPQRYEKVHLGHPASFLQGHSFTICILRSNAFSNLS